MSHRLDLAREVLRPESQVDSLEVSAVSELRRPAHRDPAERGEVQMSPLQPGDSAATYMASESHENPAREEGEPSRAVGRQHETRGPAPGAGFNPLGNWGEFGHRRRGRPRKAVRYPFLEAARRFLDSHVAYFGENTLKQRGRDLRVMARDLWSLRRKGLVTTTRPDRLSEADVAAPPACGLRRREMRLARLADLDLQRWRIRVIHPKGEGAWASDDVAPILPSARQAVLDFLEERKAFLGDAAHEALIPVRWADGTLGYWSDAPFGKLKAELEHRSGVRFSLKMFRSTFAQVAKDYGVDIESVSKALRHKTTKTTETYYARIRADDAFADFEEKFARPPVRVIPR